MATAVAFDTLKLARKLEAAGFEHKQAADTAEALAEAMTTAEIATKADIREAQAATKADITEVKADIREAQAATKADIAEVKTATMAAIAEVKTALRESEHRQAAENVAMRAALRESELRLEAKLEAKIGEVRTEIREGKIDILKWGAGLLLAQAAIIATLVKLL